MGYPSQAFEQGETRFSILKRWKRHHFLASDKEGMYPSLRASLVSEKGAMKSSRLLKWGKGVFWD